MSHVTEDDLERYVFGTADDPQRARIEEHMLVCEPCRDALVDAGIYIPTLKPLLEKTEVTVAEHSTADGPVRVSIRRASDLLWYARVVGAQLDSGIACGSSEAALRDAARQFAEMFPEHECTAECRAPARKS